MIITKRLDLISATPELTRAALDGGHALGRLLDVTVPSNWPPEFLDAAAFQFILDRFQEGPVQADWWLYFVILRGEEPDRTLIGSVGYKGPPTGDGTVEVGYGLVRDYQRKGYGYEAVRGLLEHAFAFPVIHQVIAETFPELTPSIGLLHKCGFRPIGEGSEPGVIRFVLTRAVYGARSPTLTPAVTEPDTLI